MPTKLDVQSEDDLKALVEYAQDGMDHEWGWYTDHVPALVAEIRRLRTGRWAPLTDAELRVVWDGLTLDDGIRYGAMLSIDPERHRLIGELVAESAKRGLALDGLAEVVD